MRCRCKDFFHVSVVILVREVYDEVLQHIQLEFAGQDVNLAKFVRHAGVHQKFPPAAFDRRDIAVLDGTSQDSREGDRCAMLGRYRFCALSVRERIGDRARTPW
jgi:hypothetical protein